MRHAPSCVGERSVQGAGRELARDHAPTDRRPDGESWLIRTQDIAEAVRFLLKLSPTCLVPEIVFERPGDAM